MTPHDESQHPSSSSSSSHGLSLSLASSNQHRPISRHLSTSSAKGSRRNKQQFLSAKRTRSNPSSRRGLSGQLEERDEDYNDEDRESSSTSGIFKGLASSSLLSGNHEPPHLDWSPEEVQVYFGDLDERSSAVGRPPCQRCKGECECELKEQLVWQCQECGACNSTPTGETNEPRKCDSCGTTAIRSCGRCRRSGSTNCFCDKYERGGKRDGDAGSQSDCIESDIAIAGEETNFPSSSYRPIVLSSPKRIGPNKVIVPVTVHMVDSL